MPGSRNELLSESIDTFCTFYESFYSLEGYDHVGITYRPKVYSLESNKRHRRYKPLSLYSVVSANQLSSTSTDER